ncbi:serine hydrolase domain-containing protein [Streptosporangium sp. NPDC023615]|uniref:serine hydrolase domain-containing protein n=1 Tax=Streptosporangium sp. NPDC023615 TaxID=3154794 RepID=UPI0034289A13
MRCRSRRERYLPKLVRGKGIDGRKITTRQMLRHTSGPPNHTWFIKDYFAIRHAFSKARELVDLALSKKASFAPGKGWECSNTNFILAGTIAEKVTGRCARAGSRTAVQVRRWTSCR